MISVKRCAATNLSATPHHHHHQQQHHHHNGHHVPVQVRSLSAGRAAGKSNGTAVSGITGSNNNNRLIRSRNSPYLGGGYSSGGSPGGGPAIIANGGSLYYSNNSVLGPTKSRSGLSEAGSDIYDELDSLFLVPKCALTYDKAMSLRKDLAAYDFNIRILEDTPRGNVWISGNRDASVQKQTRPSSANKDRHQRPHSVNHTLHWFACVGEDLDSAAPATATNGYGNEDELQREREERIKQTKERQNEERQRKLEELKAQALAAQKFREQKEEERRRRMEDLRRRENDRRSQVEERRRAIQEAENERRQYILQKNQERDQRMDAKRRNERSSIQFAFGSSTPRMIETSDSGMCSSFWAHRRATSITNVAYTGAPLTRRSSERELTDGSSKKRATSASGLDRSTDGLRSGEITPNSLNPSRPGSAMSSSTTASGVVYRRSLPASAGSQRKPRPISIAVTGVSGLAKEEKPPLPKSSTGNTSSTSLERKRSQSGTSTPAKPAAPDTPARKHSSAERPHRVGSNSASARGTPKASSTPLQSPGPEKANRTLHDSLVKTGKKQASQEQLATPLPKEGSSVSAKSADEKPVEVVEQKHEEQLTETIAAVESVVQEQQIIVTESKTEAEVVAEPEPVKEQPQLVEPDQVANSHEEKKDDMKDSTVAAPLPAAVTNLLDAQDGSNGDLMTASMIAKRITTEEEAKAALAERRRLAREEAERQAELERQRIAAEEEAEAQRQYEEEERLRKLEEESIRLAEEARRLEEERLQQAIEEATKREEEEKLRREEEARQKIEREESERKAREEAERQRIEMAERLKKEEKEREERRKRVEAIMSRTRAKGGSATNTPTKQSDEKDNAMSKSHIVMSSTPAVTADTTMSMTESMLGSVDQPQQSQEQDQAPSSGAESLEQAVQALSLENNNNNANSNGNGNHNNNNGDYERSVTEKENLLLGAFNNNGHDNNGSSAGSQQPSSLESSSTTPGATTNGKSTPGATTIAETTELIIEDAIMSGQTNGHKNGSIDNVFTQNPPTVDAKFLTHFDDADELAPVLPPSDATDNLTNPLDAANDDLVAAPPTSQLIDFSSFQSLTAEQSEQPPQQPADDQDPFNLNINSINNNNTNINNSSSVNPFDDDSSSLVVTGSTTSFSTNTTTSLFGGSDANLISNSNFLNNNSTRLVVTSDGQDNRDLSLL
ncbi:ensconsin isoform X17 [Culex pipiens pallens]|uniref:ensconsin isoform X17 n=1 Tax=Culex pipiens pallens TaxID=42434 RepID=UPI001953494A|nr:ensconsin isoform X17 [Culex pipiens pallens]